MPTLNFTIDSHLLQELGERLVGRPYIALAELVKNAYDADANHCQILFSGDEIEVWDDGHGMSFEEFRDFWMRIGTTNKQVQQLSRDFGRPLTGSKGIGRLAVQFLGKKVEIISTSQQGDGRRVKAEVDWDEAVDAGDLTRATAEYSLKKGRERYANGSPTGTKIILTSLNHDWSYDEDDRRTPVRALAREVWMLQPPFAEAIDDDEESAQNFQVELLSHDERMEEGFRSQLDLVLDVWDAKIQGEIRDGLRRKRCDIVVTFRDGETYPISCPLEAASIDRCTFDVRIYKLYGKQPGGIGVDEARRYFKDFGGVHVYDGGFRLPYYGIEQDWLAIQLDHSHRRSISSLLPSELNVPLAMHDLPTMERVFGVVKLSSSRELKKATGRRKSRGEFLQINIGRDRLVDNDAYQELKRVVRWSIDYYATRFQLRQQHEVEGLRPDERPEQKLDRLWDTIHQLESEVPKSLHKRLVTEIDDYYEALSTENRYIERQTALLAPLASVGMAALAFEHESNRQLKGLERLIKRLSQLDLAEEGREAVSDICEGLNGWILNHRRTRGLFAPLTSVEDRERARRLKAKNTIEVVLRNTSPLLRKLRADTRDIDAALMLPQGTMADWQALFQNVFVNASNAMLDKKVKKLKVIAGQLTSRRNYLRVSDTGVGVDLESANELFEPFVRRLELSAERKSLGLGGMGLGLTVVRMVCESRRCEFGFVEPEDGYATTFQLTWRR